LKTEQAAFSTASRREMAGPDDGEYLFALAEYDGRPLTQNPAGALSKCFMFEKRSKTIVMQRRPGFRNRR